VNRNTVKKRKDFATEKLYAEFVYEAVQKDSMVRVRSSTTGISVALSDALSSHELKVGDVGIVCSKEKVLSSILLTVKFGKLLLCLRSSSVEVVA